MHGYLEQCQLQAAREYRRSLRFDPALARRFLILEIRSMLWRGLDQDAYEALSAFTPSAALPEELIQQKTLEGMALSHLQQFAQANASFSAAERICAVQDYASCGDINRARGAMWIARGDLVKAEEDMTRSLTHARKYKDRFAEASTFINLGVISLQKDRYDEALDRFNSADRIAAEIGAQDLAQSTLGNVGWANFKLGDSDKALQLLEEAERKSAVIGDSGSEIGWLANIAYVYQSNGDLARALKSDTQYLKRAKEFGMKGDILNALEDLAHVSVAAGDFDSAAAYVEQVSPLIRSSDNRLDQLDMMLVQGSVAAHRRQESKAEEILRTVEHDPAAETSMKLGAERELAHIYERRGDIASADRTYRAALTTFASAREQLRTEISRLPFLANAAPIYDDYIHFLIDQHESDDALLVADQSRAQTLAQGLGVGLKDAAGRLWPGRIAQKTGATILFYSLGAKQSYLWAITARSASLYVLPPQEEIKSSVDRYRKSLLGFGDPLDQPDPDGTSLYQKLIAPASASLRGSNVIVLTDGPLSRLNFETLIVPAPHPHYFIEDATISSAPSLQMLASSHPASTTDRKLLLIGDAISPGPDYPNLPMASTEMQRIQKQVGARNSSIYARDNATPAAYLSSSPQQFAYIHFVAHGVSSPIDPLDSAIILSRSSSPEDSFKLHARDIIQHSIRARLVTISACYSSGSRSFVGEGPVGLAWAFMRAGAHNVIGALWEVSDQSAPQMMSDLYQGLNAGLSPAAALRQAKLRLLHSTGEFRKPFYWAPLQLYTGL